MNPQSNQQARRMVMMFRAAGQTSAAQLKMNRQPAPRIPMPPSNRLTVSDTDNDLGHGSLLRLHSLDTSGKGQYFYGIDDQGRKTLWFATKTLSCASASAKGFRSPTRNWNDPRMGPPGPMLCSPRNPSRPPCPAGVA